MNRLLFTLTWAFLCMLILSSCLVISISFKKPHRIQGLSDHLCGRNVKWHIHLQEGFYRDTVLFIVGADTLYPINNTTTTGNGCTSIYLIALKEGQNFNLYLENMPSFNLKKENALLHKDSVQVDLIINGRATLKFRESTKRYNFFGFNYDSTRHSITCLKSERCFGCE